VAAVFAVLLVVNGAGDTAVGFLVFWLLVTLASAEAGAWVGLASYRSERRGSARGS